MNCNKMNVEKPKYAPNVKKWEKKGGSHKINDDGDWEFTDWGDPARTVVYSSGSGLPDFKNSTPNPPAAVLEEVNIGKFKGRGKDKYAAIKGSKTQGSYEKEVDWHHEDNGVMQAVDRSVHKRFSHRGGFSMFVGGKK